MSGKIRSQLGPVKKRVSDRIKEASNLIQDGDSRQLKDFRTKFNANIALLEKLTTLLSDVVDTVEADEVATDNALAECAELTMDASEIIATIEQRLEELEIGDSKYSVQRTAIMQGEKVEREIEKLKVETDYKRSKMEQLKNVDGAERKQKQRIKLPTVTLPTFSGKIIDWPSFWDSFDSTIHSNADISKIDKFKYLMSCLQDDAKSTVIGYRLTESQYDVAIAQLKERYDDKEFIIHNHYEILTNLPRCSNVTHNLRKLFNVIETQLRSLQSLGENIESKHLVALIKSKLPQQLNRKLEEDRTGEWTTGNFRKAIHKLILAREKTEEEPPLHSFTDDIEYTAEGLFSKDSKVKCIFCEKNHWSDECQRYKTLGERKEKIKGRCFICLSSDHFFRRCGNEKPCFYCKRRKNHHSSLCPDKFGVRNEKEDRRRDDDDVELFGDEISLHVDQEVLMKTAKVTIKNPSSDKTTFAIVLMDTGAKHTYITTEKARAIGIKGESSEVVKLNTFGTDKQSTMRTSKTSFMIHQNNGFYKKIDARICETVTGTITKKKISMDKYSKVCKDLQMADDLPDRDRRIKIDILIGNDYYDEFITSEKLKIDRGLYLVNSSLGWMFSGRADEYRDEDEETIMLADDCNTERTFWDIETIGISGDTQDSENMEVIRQFDESIRMIGKRYEVSWPWKLSRYELPSNYILAESRLKSLVMKLSRSQDVMKKYDDVIRQQLEDGIVEIANSSEEYMTNNTVVTHYLPHHSVVNTTGENVKVRIVLEGCAKTHPSKKSLNDCLYRGPNKVANLCGILMRFRLNQVALIADIEKAYLQLQLREDDRDVTRFLWLKDILKPFSNENIVQLRFCRVIWGIVPAAFLLAMTVLHHLKKYDSDVSKTINMDMYVDNLITGVSSDKEAKSFYHQTKAIFNDASMNMCKWNCSSKAVMKEIKEEDRCDEKVTKLLGMMWMRDNDEIGLAKIINVLADKVTKRSVLQFISGRFDPLGILAPVFLRAKLFLQELWRKKIHWDEVLSEDKVKEWNIIAKEVVAAETLTVKRFIGIGKTEEPISYSLITFTDASKSAYAAAVYLKVTNSISTKVSLIFSKSRLSPINQQLTIPRLELLGVLIGCRVSKFVGGQLGIPECKQTLFTDSECVIEWCSSSKELKRFVRDKIKEIHTYNIDIGYVSSKENPADVASRGESAMKLKCNDLWWQGPEWLILAEPNWPYLTYTLNDELRSAVMNEESGSKILFETGLLSDSKALAEVESPFHINELKFSTCSKLIRTTAWCLRFVYNVQKKTPTKMGFLTVDELRDSETLWVKTIQKRHFNDVLIAIEEDKKNQMKSNLGIYKDNNGILRCAGRLVNLPVHPKLLPKLSIFTKLCIVKCHRRILHAGLAQTLAEVRSEYWIPQGRAAVRKVLRACLVCIHWEGGPFSTPHFAPLPQFVMSDENPPFTFTGLDYMGPLFIKEDVDSTKNWICLFTCLNVRAVHLELIEDMSTESFLLCLRRFIARRGTPSSITSDNASQLKLGYSIIANVWNSIVESNDVQSYAANQAIKWKFITEYAPWQGGFYERLIGITKRSLRKALSTSKATRIELATLIIEIEAIVNSRPLTYVENDIESGISLTPAHFLSINHKTGTPDVELNYIPDQNARTHLLEMWKKGQCHLKRFWQSWLTEYLPALRERYNVQMKPFKGEVGRKPKVGEVVIIKEEGLPRGRWKLARVRDLIRSEIDGIERAVKLQYPSGRITTRPLRLLYPLECKVDYDYDDDDDNDNEVVKEHSKIDDDDDYNENHVADEGKKESDTSHHQNIRTRSTRDAASAARLRIRMQCDDSDTFVELGV